jgi:hypothetical protein
MKSLIEFFLYAILAILFYRNIYIKNTANTIHHNTLNKKTYNNIFIEYNNSFNEFNEKQYVYNQRCNKNDYTQRIINYNDYIYKGQVLYGIKHGCGIVTYHNEILNEIKYEGIWENNTENGFGILYKNDVTIIGNKKNNKYDGLIKIQTDLFTNILIKRIDCIFVDGLQKYCFVIYLNDEYNYIPEYYTEKYNFYIKNLIL